MIIEDEVEKAEDITREVNSFFGAEVKIVVSGTFAEATRRIMSEPFDLIVADLLLPRRRDDEPTDISEELIEHLSESPLNSRSIVVAVSRFGDLVEQHHSAFTKSAIFLIPYQDGAEWRSCLRICMQRVAFRQVYDFVVLCALDEERSAFAAVNDDTVTVGELFKRQGLDCREMTIRNFKGVCILQPRMGLVDASIVATRALAIFTPRVICMSGICGGFHNEVTLGSLVVSDVCWEHQAGKWRGDNFEVRSYHEGLDNDVRVSLSQLIESDPSLSELASKTYQVQVPRGPAVLRPTVSGSAVIASEDHAREIARQHGKVAAVDMEIFGVYRAAALHGERVMVFAAKTVVDYADEKKADDIHTAGAVLSARFVVKALTRLLSSA